jgi:hypothetical protein
MKNFTENDCYEKARELGRMVLGTEYADRVRIAAEVADDIESKDAMAARQAFNGFLEQVAGILRATVTGEMPAEEPAGHCGGCGWHD